MRNPLKSREARKKLQLNGIAFIIAIVFLFPLYWIVISSLKTDTEIFSIPQTFFPKVIEFGNYIDILFGQANALQGYMNSIIIALSAMSVSMLLGIPAAYGISRYKLPFKSSIITVFLVTQMLPASLLLTPLYLTYWRLHLLNTYLGPILSVATISIPFIVIILRPIFMAYPRSIEDAAKIDGCNRLTVFTRIILPVTKPGVITVMAFSFVHGWNDLVYSMTFNSKPELKPMTASIYNLITQFGIQWNKVMAYGVLLVLPVVIMFVALQKYIVGGLTGGAVKG